MDLQQTHETYLVVADLHTLTTRPEKRSIVELRRDIREMVLDYLAAGIDPDRAVIYLQSAVTEVYELNLILEMLVGVSRLSRLPSLKDMARNARLKEMPFGLLGYPVLQAADILLPRAHLVPVGQDNAAHVEVTREIVRRFNGLYGEVFPLPEALIGDTPSLVGTDGRSKMSKSAGNAIYLSDDREAVEKKVGGMYTDPRRVRADVPGRVEGNPVFVYHDLFNMDRAEVQELKRRYREGSVGDVEVKRRLAAALNRFLDPLRRRRTRFASERGLVARILSAGTRRMRAEAAGTMAEVRSAMGLDVLWEDIDGS